MASDLDLVDNLIIEYLAELASQRQADKVLCRCQACSIPGVPLWERVNFTHRSKAAKHCREERQKNNLPPPQKGSNAEQSFWKPENVIAAFKREARQALQQDAAAEQPPTFTQRSQRCDCHGNGGNSSHVLSGTLGGGGSTGD